MTNDKSSASVSMAILDRVPKLQDHEGYLKWRRTMRDNLKMLELWTYVDDQAEEPTGVSETKMATWRAGHDKTCTALRLVVDGNAYNDIEDLTNASTAWKLLEETFKPRGSGFLNDTFQKLHTLTLADCKSPVDYVLQFRSIVNELRNFSGKLRLDENWLIYLFLSNLGPEHSSYFETYAQEHDPFTEDGEAKFTLSSTMHHFQNTVKNPSSKPISDKATVTLIAANMPAHQSTVQDGAQIGTSHSRVLTLQKTVKYCTFCKRDYHTENECRIKHPNLAPKPSSKPSRKRRRKASENGNTTTTKPEDNTSYFAQGEIIQFMATQDLSASILRNVWVWDCGCSQHVTPDRSVFTTFRKLTGQKPVKGLAGSLVPIGVGTVQLTCIGLNGPQSFHLDNVLYIPEAAANLISQGQIHREGQHHLEITPDGILVGSSGIIARLISNNLYLVYLTDSSQHLPTSESNDAVFTAINKDTIKMWHVRLGHLGEQNI